MKLATLFCGLLILPLVTATPLPATTASPDDFRYAAPLTGELTRDTLYRVRLNADLLEKCGPQLGDIRVFDGQGQEIPYTILPDITPAQPVATFTFQVIDYATRDDVSRLILEAPADFQPIREMELVIPQKDFHKGVAVFGSHNRRDWKLLAEDAVFDFTSQVDLRRTTIMFDTPADYRFFRMDIRQDAPAESAGQLTFRYGDLYFNSGNIRHGLLKINEVVGRTGKMRRQTVNYDEQTFTSFILKTDRFRNTIVEIDAALPLDRVELDVGNTIYYRTVQVLGTNSDKEDRFLRLATGVVHSIPLGTIKQVRQEIDCPGLSYRRYRLVVENGDNPPLDIRRVTFYWIRRNLFLAARDTGGTYTIHVGNPQVAPPNYDLRNFIRADNWFLQSYQPLPVGELRPNPDYVAPVLTDGKNRLEQIILTAAVILVVVLLAAWLVTLLRRGTETKPPPGPGGIQP
ncbi:MAG: DUF3999 family protein [Acidobacteria bacterium]|nr:DUF3999 family protein [Acidobacteriota bacterium]